MHITPYPNVERKIKQGMSKYESEEINGISEGVNEKMANAYINQQVWE